MSADRLSAGHQPVMTINSLDEGDGRPAAATVSDQDATRVSHVASLLGPRDDLGLGPTG